MINTVTAQIVLQLTRGASAISLTSAASVSQTATALDRRTCAATTSFVAYTPPAGITDIKWLGVGNPSDNTYNILVSLDLGSTTHLTITPGQGVLLCGVDKTKLCFKHSGGASTQDYDLFVIPT